ncbi:hypothetical protein BD324DRAFT_656836 [Kockovaella imperatae]|uniref:Short-chain dehydrogenase/reductase 3 n=1 Tax=Kockovaella imperatae TaxID=4999 RepID=A0A1Y1UEF1_9TREE|nr:hypothetical protein BD324DRAFT_656836 [Kockovaella imperatae]ORX36408.1 hypothetical protein BD324DRAFT_656836 [Kockovaella imperatae]
MSNVQPETSAPVTGQGSTAQAQMLNLDIIIRVLSKTIFAPSFCIFIPLTFLSQLRSTSHPVFIWSCVWTALVCLTHTLLHIDRLYSNQWSWLFSPSKLNWGDQVVLITGGGSGIGALLAETLAMRNVTVVVLTKTPAKLEVQNDNVHTYVCDVSDLDAVEKVAVQVREEVGDPTILVNNAGVVKGKLLLDLNEEDIKDSFGSNTLAQFWTLKTFLPAMIRAGHGHVVSLTSVLGLVGAAQMTDYCASKAALVSLHQTLRAELDARYLAPNVRTTLVIPAFVHTNLFACVKLPTSRLFNFLAPHLEPHVVVKEIIDALDCHESRVIRLPWYTNLARIMGPGVGIVPKWLADLLQWIAGADQAMSEYGPKPDAGERLLVERRVTDQKID